MVATCRRVMLALEGDGWLSEFFHGIEDEIDLRPYEHLFYEHGLNHNFNVPPWLGKW